MNDIAIAVIDIYFNVQMQKNCSDGTAIQTLHSYIANISVTFYYVHLYYAVQIIRLFCLLLMIDTDAYIAVLYHNVVKCQS